MSSDGRAKELVDLGNKLFSHKVQLDGLNQEIAYQFCPDLAEFTRPLMLGEDWASDRMDGFPEQVSRELSNIVGAMLRPQDRPWFKVTTLDEEADANEENAIALNYMTSTVRRGLYDPKTKFIRATKECDRFYINFGMGVLSAEEYPGTRDRLYFQNHHLRNCAWMENKTGDVDHLHRKQKMTARTMLQTFKRDKLDQSIVTAASREPTKEFEVRVIVLPSDEYDSKAEKEVNGKKRKLPYVICYVDAENNKVLREDSLPDFIYVVPRWHRFSHSQYAFSPAVMPALADARMTQMLGQIILESGEKAVDPPMIGKQEMMIGEPNLMAGGISWVDLEHDASLKDALDVIKIDADMRIGFEMRRDIREMLSKSFFLDKLALPETGKEMTAYEVAQRMEQHVRNLLPLFEPMQIEYNSRLLDLSFNLLNNMGKFDWSRVPDELRGSDVSWAFESPIQQAKERVMVEQYKASLEVLAFGMQAGAVSKPMDVDKAMRDAIRGVGGPAIWRTTVAQQEAEAEEMSKQKLIAQAMQEASQTAVIAGQVGDAGNKLGLQPTADQMLAAEKAAPGTEAVANAAGGTGAQGDAANAMQELVKQTGVTAVQPQPQAQMLERQPQQQDDVMMMQRRILRALDSIGMKLDEPKKIKIIRDKSGRIIGADTGKNHEQV